MLRVVSLVKERFLQKNLHDLFFVILKRYIVSEFHSLFNKLGKILKWINGFKNINIVITSKFAMK